MKNEITLSQAMNVLKKELLKEDISFGWQSNIAMSIADAEDNYIERNNLIGKTLKYYDKQCIYNEGALMFINKITSDEYP